MKEMTIEQMERIRSSLRSFLALNMVKEGSVAAAHYEYYFLQGVNAVCTEFGIQFPAAFSMFMICERSILNNDSEVNRVH